MVTRSTHRCARMSAVARQRLGEEQFHRAAVDFAGDGARRPADRPDAEDRLHERVDVADGEHVHRLVELDRLAADERLNDLARPGEQDIGEVLQRVGLAAGQHAEERRDLADDALRDPAPTGPGTAAAASRRRTATAARRGAACAPASASCLGSVIAVIDAAQPERLDAQVEDRLRGEPFEQRRQLPGVFPGDAAVVLLRAPSAPAVAAQRGRPPGSGRGRAGACCSSFMSCKWTSRPRLEDGDAVADLLDLAEDVRREQDRLPSVAGLPQLGQQFVAHGRVEGVGRLVEDEQRGVRHAEPAAAPPCASCRTTGGRWAGRGRFPGGGRGRPRRRDARRRAARRGSGRVGGRSCSRTGAARRGGRRCAGGR